MIDLLNQQNQPVFVVFNMLEAIFSLDDLTRGANLVTRQRVLFQHPKLREAIMITQNRMVDLAAKGLNSPIFGHIKIRVFKTLDEALMYIREAAQH